MHYNKLSSEKNKKNNAYIQKVEDAKEIINIETDAFELAWKWGEYFWNDNDIVLEIGTWLWNFFSWELKNNPDKNFIWKDIRFKRIYNTYRKAKNTWSSNFVLVKTRWENINKVFADWELSLTYVFFPDPWARKEKQLKNRLFSEKFILDLYKKTKKWGKLIFKTDHREYFDTTIDLFKKLWVWKINIESRDYEKELEVFDKKNLTEFETIFREHKMQINYAEFEK